MSKPFTETDLRLKYKDLALAWIRQAKELKREGLSNRHCIQEALTIRALAKRQFRAG